MTGPKTGATSQALAVHLLCKHEPAFQRFHSFTSLPNVSNNFGNLLLARSKPREHNNIRPPDIVPRKPVRFLGLLGTLRPRNGSRVEFPETVCGFGSGPGKEPRELAIDEAN